MKRFVIAAITAGSIALPFAGTASAAAKPTVTFSISGAPAGSSVIFVGLDTAKKIAVTDKKIELPSTFKRKGESAYRFSVHFISAEGRYLGPTVFGVKGTTKWTTNVMTKGPMKIGKITYKEPGWGKSSVKLSKGQYGRTLTGAGKDGKPKSAGKVGVVFKSGVSAMSVNASAAQVCPGDVDQTLGGDCDADGVLNAIDADDDNDGIMDIADKTTEQFPAAGWTPTAGIRTTIGGSGSLKVLNANINTATLDADIDNALGGPDASFSLAFFFNLTNEDARAMDAGWIDCGALEYCSATVGTAKTSPASGPLNSVFNQFYCKEVNSGGGCMHSVLWKDFTGMMSVNGVGSKVEDKGSGITNGMQFNDSPEGVSWVGTMKPSGVVNPREKMKVGDPYLGKLRYKADGSVKTVPMSLGAYIVTSPAIIKVNDVTVDYTMAAPVGSKTNPIIVPESGVLDLWWYRPQRTAIEGSDPAGAKYMDLGGLDYGFSIEADPNNSYNVIKSRDVNGRLFGCGNKNAYTLSGTITETPSDGSGGADLWNLRDSSTDAAPAADRMIHVAVDFKKCVQSQASKLYVDSARLAVDPTMELQLQSAGANTSGGRSGSIQLFTVKFPASAAAWATK